MIPGPQASSERPWLAPLSTSVTVAGRIRAVCAAPLGGHIWKPGSGFSWTLPSVSLSFADFNMHPFRTVRITAFSEFCESCLQITQQESGLESPNQGREGEQGGREEGEGEEEKGRKEGKGKGKGEEKEGEAGKE